MRCDCKNCTDFGLLCTQGVPRKGGKDWPFGISAFTPDAEVVLGRTAMLGFVGLLITEYVKGHAVF